MKKIESSVIREVGHKNNTMTVVFNSGAVWSYSDVSVELYNKFLNSESKGRFFVNNIRSHEAKRLDDDVKKIK